MVLKKPMDLVGSKSILMESLNGNLEFLIKLADYNIENPYAGIR